jgi:hypothetical protein
MHALTPGQRVGNLSAPFSVYVRLHTTTARLAGQVGRAGAEVAVAALHHDEIAVPIDRDHLHSNPACSG